jgi:putative endonuclease
MLPRATARQARGRRMTYVYILRSLEHLDRFYIGVTVNLRSRLRKHNAREIAHTSKYAPWAIKTYVAFTDEKQAFAFEKYLKSASGRAFAKKRL